MSSFFLQKGTEKRNGNTKLGPRAAKKRRMKGDDDENTAANRRKKVIENEIIASDEEYSGDEDAVGAGSADSDAEYEDSHEKNYRQAKNLLESLTKEKDAEEIVEGEGFEISDIRGKLKEHAAIKAGTLHRKLAACMEIAEDNEVFYKRHRFSPLSAAISPCGKYIISTGKDSQICKYSLERKQIVGVIKRVKNIPKELQHSHSGHIFAVAISPDGKYIASGGNDCIVKIWEFDTLKHVKDLAGHRMPITSLRFKLRSAKLFSASRDRTVKLWDLDHLGLVDTMYGHQDAVLAIDSLNKERALTCGGQDRTVRLWKVDAESQLILNGSYDCISIDCVAMLNEDHFVSGATNGSLCLWSIFRKKPTAVRQLAHGQRSATEAHWIVSVAACPFSDLFVSGSDDGVLRFWRVAEDYKSMHLKMEYEMLGFINDLRFSNDGEQLVCAVGKDHKFGRWWVHEQAENKVILLPLRFPGAVSLRQHRESSE